MRFVRSEVLERREADFDARRLELPRHYDLTPLDDPLAGQSLKFYLLLTEMPDLLADERPSAEVLFWSRYYWFLRYVRLREAVAGRDAGLEQQTFQILEHPHPASTPDWSMIEEVEAAVGRDVAEHLRAAGDGTPRGLSRSSEQPRREGEAT